MGGQGCQKELTWQHMWTKCTHVIFEVHCSNVAKKSFHLFNLFLRKNLLPYNNLVNTYLSFWTYINTYICLQENILKMQFPKPKLLLVIPSILEMSKWSRGSHLGRQTVEKKMLKILKIEFETLQKIFWKYWRWYTMIFVISNGSHQGCQTVMFSFSVNQKIFFSTLRAKCCFIGRGKW